MTEDKKMDKTPVEKAWEWAEKQVPNRRLDNVLPSDIRAWTEAYQGHLAGYKASQERALLVVDEVKDLLSEAYDNGRFMESDWGDLVAFVDTIKTAIRGKR